MDYAFVDFEIGWGTRALIDRAFAQAGIQRRTAFDVTDLETIVELVGNGLGIALLPETIAGMRCPRSWSSRIFRGEGAKPVNGAAQAFYDLLEFH